MGEALLTLVQALARQDAEDYLREQAAADSANDDHRENPVLPATSEAA